MSPRNENTEPADPARRLGLLWGDRHHSARRGKHELNLAKIVAAGIALADESGVTALSMRKVAERLGVGTMSLYTYVPGKEDLVEVMIDTVYAEIAAGGDLGAAEDATGSGGPSTAPQATGGIGSAAGPRAGAVAESDDPSAGSRPSGADAIAASGAPLWWRRSAAVAWDSFRAHVAHAWLVRVPTGRVVLGPGAAAKYERELSALDGIGLSDVEMDSVVALLGGHVTASARRVVDAEQERRASGLTEQQWWTANAPLLAAFADPRRFPTAARVGTAAGSEHGSAYAADGGFGFGLARILDGVSLLIDANGGG